MYHLGVKWRGMRLQSVRTRGEQLQRLNINSSLSYTRMHTYKHTLTDSPLLPAYLYFVLGLSEYHWRRAWFESASGIKREGDREKERKREMIEGRRGREKRLPSMTSKEITHSPELLFSCYHFPRHYFFHIRPQVWVCVSTFCACMSLYEWVAVVCLGIQCTWRWKRQNNFESQWDDLKNYQPQWCA